MSTIIYCTSQAGFKPVQDDSNPVLKWPQNTTDRVLYMWIFCTGSWSTDLIWDWMSTYQVYSSTATQLRYYATQQINMGNKLMNCLMSLLGEGSILMLLCLICVKTLLCTSKFSQEPLLLFSGQWGSHVVFSTLTMCRVRVRVNPSPDTVRCSWKHRWVLHLFTIL